MSTESLLITTTIEVSENIDVAIVGIPCAFLVADMEEEVILVIEGELYEIMESISPSTYRECVSVGITEERPYMCSYRKFYVDFLAALSSSIEIKWVRLRFLVSSSTHIMPVLIISGSTAEKWR